MDTCYKFRPVDLWFDPAISSVEHAIASVPEPISQSPASEPLVAKAAANSLVLALVLVEEMPQVVLLVLLMWL